MRNFKDRFLKQDPFSFNEEIFGIVVINLIKTYRDEY